MRTLLYSSGSLRKIDDDFSIIKRGDNLSFAEFSTNGTNARTIFAPTIDSNLTGFSGAIDTEFENDKVYIAKSGSIDNLKIYTVEFKQVTGSTTHTFPNLALITSSGDYFDGTVYSQNKFVQGNYIYGLVPGDNGRLSYGHFKLITDSYETYVF